MSYDHTERLWLHPKYTAHEIRSAFQLSPFRARPQAVTQNLLRLPPLDCCIQGNDELLFWCDGATSQRQRLTRKYCARY